MNDLISYLQNYLQTPSRSVSPRTGGGLPSVPGRALQSHGGPPIIDTTGYEVHGIPNFAKDRGFGPAGEVASKAIARRALGTAGSGLFDAALGPMGAVIGAGDGRPDNSLSDMQALQNALHDARKHGTAYPAGAVTSAPLPPVGPRAGDPGAPHPPISGISPGYQDVPPAAPQAAPSASPDLPWWATGDMTKMFPGASSAPAAAPPVPAPTAPQAAPVPMPQARPAEAPQDQPDTSFFMRNALMMHDPATGALIDPQGAASVRGPDLISKMMTYLHNK